MGRKLLFAGSLGNLNAIAVARGLKGVKGAEKVGSTSVVTKGEKSLLVGGGGGGNTGAEWVRSLKVMLNPYFITFWDLNQVRNAQQYTTGFYKFRRYNGPLEGDPLCMMQFNESTRSRWIVDDNYNRVSGIVEEKDIVATSIGHWVSNDAGSTYYPADASKDYSVCVESTLLSGRVSTGLTTTLSVRNGDTRVAPIVEGQLPTLTWQPLTSTGFVFFDAYTRKPFLVTPGKAHHDYSNRYALRLVKSNLIEIEEQTPLSNGWEGEPYWTAYPFQLPEGCFTDGWALYSYGLAFFGVDASAEVPWYIISRFKARADYGWVAYQWGAAYQENIGLDTEQEYVDQRRIPYPGAVPRSDSEVRAEYRAEIARYRNFLKRNSDEVIGSLKQGVLPDIWERQLNTGREMILSPWETWIDGENLGMFPHWQFFRDVSADRIRFFSPGSLRIINSAGGGRSAVWRDAPQEKTFPYGESSIGFGWNLFSEIRE